MLHSDSGVWLNGNSAPASSAIFPHDVVQTQQDHTAKVDADGSTVTVQAETIVQFEGDEFVLDHGALQVNTSRAMRVRVNCLTVIPVTLAWTRYDVIDVDGKVRVIAYENDVKIHYAGATAGRSKESALSDVTVHQGEEATREERCGAAARPADVIDAKGAILNSTWARVAGGAALASLCVLICRGDNPISPAKP